MNNNSIDFGKIYGITGDCAGGPCEFTGNVVPNTPSLEQIASYNIQLRAREIPNPEVERKLRTLEEAIGEPIITSIPGSNSVGAGSPMAAPGPQSTPDYTSVSDSVSTSGGTTSIDESISGSYGYNMSMPQQTLGTPMTNGIPAGSDVAPITEFNQPFPVTGESIQYLNGFMRTQIGRRVEIQMLIGNDTVVTKEGFLLGIGANYVLINEVDKANTNTLTSCDFYSIKFVRFFY